jgi:hypothetical protein
MQRQTSLSKYFASRGAPAVAAGAPVAGAGAPVAGAGERGAGAAAPGAAAVGAPAPPGRSAGERASEGALKSALPAAGTLPAAGASAAAQGSSAGRANEGAPGAQAGALAAALGALASGTSGGAPGADSGRSGGSGSDTDSEKLGITTRGSTPLLQQWRALKAENPDCTLLVECGYKYIIMGADASAAAQVLSIAAFPDKKSGLPCASFPVHRLAVQVRRLVDAGMLVGVVRQTESAALRKEGARGLFRRELVGLYSSACFVEDATLSTSSRSRSWRGAALASGASSAAGSDSAARAAASGAGADAFGDGDGEADADVGADVGADVDADADAAATTAASAAAAAPEIERDEGARVLISMAESPTSEGLQLGLVSVDVCRGALQWDSFSDSAERTALAERLAALRPVELLAPAALSPETERTLAAQAARGARLARVAGLAPAASVEALREFYGQHEPRLLEEARALPPAAAVALAHLARHLARFRLERALCPQRLESAAGPSGCARLALSTAALEDLGVASANSSLTLERLVAGHAQTPPGRRLVRCVPLRWSGLCCSEEAARDLPPLLLY